VNRHALVSVEMCGRFPEHKGARKSSIKGTIGLYETSHATLPARVSFLYITGLKKNHACIMIGMTCWRSLKKTVATEEIRAIPRANKKSMKKAIGIKSNAQERCPPIAKIIKKSAMKDSPLSIRIPKEVLKGKIILGK